MTKDEARELVKTLEDLNPYPSDVFTPPTDKEWKRVAPLLKENGIVPDRIFGKFGRMVWANCISKLKDQL